MGPLVGGCRMLLSGEPGEWDSRGPRATAAPSGAMSGILALLGSARGPSQTPTTGSTFCKAWEVSLELSSIEGQVSQAWGLPLFLGVGILMVREKACS